MIRNRRHARYLVKPRLYVAMNGATTGGILYDVSVDGMALDVVGPKPASERVLLNFDMLETAEHFEGTGKIIWNSESGNRVGIQFVDLPEKSHLKIKSWLSAKSISSAPSQNVVVQDRMDATFIEYPSWLRERAPSPTSSAVLEISENKQRSTVEGDQHLSSRVQPLPMTPAPPLAAVVATETDERAARDLRSTFSRRVAVEPNLEHDSTPDKTHEDWKRVAQWLMTAAAVLLAVLLLTAAIRISTSESFSIGSAYHKLANGAVKLFKSSEPVYVAPPKISYTNPAPSKEVRAPVLKHAPDNPEVNPGASNNPPIKDKFEVMDAQHGRRYFPRTSTNLIVQFEKSGVEPGNIPESTNSATAPASASAIFVSRPSANAPDRTVPDIDSTRFGRVLRQSSGELPVTETMPEYPAFALQTNVQGRVVLTAIITKDGSLEDVRILSSPSVLDVTVLEAVRTWRYQPHLENDKPVEAVTEIIVDFSITQN